MAPLVMELRPAWAMIPRERAEAHQELRIWKLESQGMATLLAQGPEALRECSAETVALTLRTGLELAMAG